MPVIDTRSDIESRTLTITAQFAAPVERIWAIYADPRQLEKIWGPPTYPATFVTHDLVEGGGATYYMTAPDGQKFGGWWKIVEVSEPERLVFDDGFADDDLNPVDSAPVGRNVYTFTAHEGGTRAVYESVYATAEDLQKVLDMGVIEGATGSLNQIDALVAEG